MGKMSTMMVEGFTILVKLHKYSDYVVTLIKII